MDHLKLKNKIKRETKREMDRLRRQLKNTRKWLNEPVLSETALNEGKQY